MPSAGKPWWQQATALVSLGAGGAITGFSFVPQSPAELTSPTGMPIHLQALELSARNAPTDDAKLRSAIVNVATYYLRMAASKTAAEMQAIIWQRDSVDGADHGASCAAFASLTLELGANVVGQHSWVGGGTTYPWPLHKWADVRVNPNPESPGVTSIVQDAQAHHRWHALGDGYQAEPGDWVVFDGHVEVVTKYSGGVLHTIGGDSLPNFSVNAHAYGDPLDAQGVLGFVDNGGLATATAAIASSGQQGTAGSQAQAQADVPVAIPGTGAAAAGKRQAPPTTGGAAIPGMASQPAGSSRGGRPTASQPGRGQSQHGREHTAGGSPSRPAPDHTSPGGNPADGARPGAAAGAGAMWAEVPGPVTRPPAAAASTVVIPGLPIMAHHLSDGPAGPARPAGPATAPYRRHRPPPPAAPVHDTAAQQAFIGEVAPGAIAAQRRYGVPASVTIAQAIDESGWGQSHLAVNDHNLFGIKGTGPAGTDPHRTSEYVDGTQVTVTKSFRVYNSTAESIDDHGRLLATSQYYRRSMAKSQYPNAFAKSLAGVYATDPKYGEKLIGIMRRYDLYRYDTLSAVPTAQTPAPVSHAAAPSSHTAPRPAHTARQPVQTSPQPAQTSPQPAHSVPDTVHSFMGSDSTASSPSHTVVSGTPSIPGLAEAGPAWASPGMLGVPDTTVCDGEAAP